MVTNAHETQMVGSLGVKLGPAGEAAGESRCPLTGMVREAREGEPATDDGKAMSWTRQASARVQQLPEFVREMVRAGIERFAREHGHDEVDETVLEQARAALGMEPRP